MGYTQIVYREFGAGQCLSLPAPEVVDGQKEFFPRSESEYSKCTNSVNHRRLQIGMGSAHRNTASQRPVTSVDSRKQTHKLAGNAGCFPCSKTFQAKGSKSNSIVENRQLNSRSICQQTRRDKVCRPLFANLGSPAMVQGQCSKVDSSTHSREKECYRRSPVKRSVDKAHRVDSTPRYSRFCVQKVRKTTHRSLCNSLKQKTSGILLTNTRPGSKDSRCPLNELERDNRIRLSTPILIPRVLEKVASEDCIIILIAPHWPRQSWFPLLLRLLISQPIKLPEREDLLSQSQGRIWHPDPAALNLVAWKLSRKDDLKRAFQSELLSLWPAQDVKVLHVYMTQDSNDTTVGVENGVSIPLLLL